MPTEIISHTPELDDTPTVRTADLANGPYIQVLGLMHEPVLDLTCTEALNLAMRLIAEAGAGFNRKLADRLPQTWPTT